MPDLTDIVYSRDATIRAFRDYFAFLVELYMDESEIISPPEEGWPGFTSEFQRATGKSDEVVALLRHLPYLRDDTEDDNGHACQATPVCYWANWQSIAGNFVRAVADTQSSRTDEECADIAEGLKVCMEGEHWENVPAHVVGLTYGGRENPVFLLDTKLGIVHWPLCDGGGNVRDPKSDNDPDHIEPVWGVEEHVPENEIDWRESEPAWAIEDFFELLKVQYRTLRWIPINSRQVIPTNIDFDVDSELKEMVPMLQGIYRKHGWPPESGGSQYRKRECLAAVEKALRDQYPSFSPGAWV